MKGIRGRESSASREVIIRDDDEGIIARPRPPAGLTVEEADEWIGLCNAVPATYFPPATWHVVTSLCRHIVVERHIAQMIAHVEHSTKKNFDLAKYERLIRHLRSESEMIAKLLRTLRLTHLAAYAKDRAPLPEAVPKPWLS
jgi:hypothetical protein